MKFIILNDTSKYHHGCKAVMRYIHTDLLTHNHEILQRVGANQENPEIDMDLYKESDAILVNGEGTMHHNFGATTYFLLPKLEEAQWDGKKTYLINSVWQEMTNEYDEMLRNLDYLSVREVLSQRELKEKHDVDANIHLDLSYNLHVPSKLCENKFGRITGQFKGREHYEREGYRQVNIFEMEWKRIVDLLANSEYLITGRHHEMYAACRARCPFLILDNIKEFSTHKNRGFIETSGFDIPIVEQATEEEIIHAEKLMIGKIQDRTYQKLFNWMMEQPRFSIGDIE